MRQPAAMTALRAGALACFLSPAVVAAPPTAADPWARVPALPTSCYAESDGFADALTKAQEALEADLAKQQEQNSAIDVSLSHMEPMATQTRMQNFLMKNPQDAMKYMQETQALGAAVQETVPKNAARQQQLDDEYAALKTKYDAELQAVLAPYQAKITALDINDGEGGNPPAVIAQWVALVKKENEAYEKLCPAWWSAGGRFPAWLAAYKAFQRRDVPLWERSDAAKKKNFEIMGVPAANFRSTFGMEAVRTYMRKASEVFGARWPQPLALPQ